jgi:uncharacterized membrane protein YGL010W
MESSPQVKPRLAAYFREYAGFHRTPGNEYCHYLGIPMIMLAILGLFGKVAFGPAITPELRLDLGVLSLIAATAWYLTLDWRIGAPFGLLSLGVYFVGRAIPSPWLWGLFVLGWVFQLVGHYWYEKKSPAFMKNIEHILIGPLWVFARILKII